jgi:hypothetical protein
MGNLIEIITADVWWKAVLILIAIAIPYIWSSFQRLQLAQNEIFHREAHNLNVFKNLADPNGGTQMAGAAILIERLTKTPKKEFEISERRAIIRTMISITKYEGASTEFCKTVADNVPRALGVLDVPKTRLNSRSPSPMREFDWQGVRLYRAFWRGIDARQVDFFGARLVDVGMRDAHLSGAIFKEAVLIECFFEGADLSGADLREADLRGSNFRRTNLQEAKLEGAIYDETTMFPDGFSPEKALMIRSASKELAE